MSFSSVYVFVLLCVHELVCVRLSVCYFCMCLSMCVARARHDPCTLGNKPFETRDRVPCTMWSIFLKALFNKFSL